MTEPAPQSWDQFWQGVMTGSIPSIIAGLAWLRGFIKDRINRHDAMDQGFREYLINDNLDLKNQLKELRSQLGSLQVEVGKTQQKVDAKMDKP